MSSVLRDAPGLAQPLDWTRRSAAAPKRDPEIERLEREVANLRKAMDQAEREAEAAVETARAETRREAETAFKQDEKHRLDLLQAALDQSVSAVHTTLTRLEALAPQLCERALSNVFDRSDDLRDLVERALAKQIAPLRSELVICMRVSAADFTSDDAIAALSARLPPPPAQLKRDENLPAGECVIELRLGQIELSLPRYWNELKAALEAAVAEALA